MFYLPSKKIIAMKYKVKLLFRDGVVHYLETSSIREARTYLEEIHEGFSLNNGRTFKMLNNKGEIIFVCNLNNLIHAMIVEE